jgi:hypothetical protein
LIFFSKSRSFPFFGLSQGRERNGTILEGKERKGGKELEKGKEGEGERMLGEGKGRGKDKTWGTFPFGSLSAIIRKKASKK